VTIQQLRPRTLEFSLGRVMGREAFLGDSGIARERTIQIEPLQKENPMKGKLLCGTLALALAAMASPVAQTPTPEASQPAPQTQNQTGKKTGAKHHQGQHHSGKHTPAKTHK